MSVLLQGLQNLPGAFRVKPVHPVWNVTILGVWPWPVSPASPLCIPPGPLHPALHTSLGVGYLFKGLCTCCCFHHSFPLSLICPSSWVLHHKSNYVTFWLKTFEQFPMMYTIKSKLVTPVCKALCDLVFAYLSPFMMLLAH